MATLLALSALPSWGSSSQTQTAETQTQVPFPWENPETDLLSVDTPEDQVAPAGLDIGEGADPIVFLEAIAMREELSNLLGRFQNAQLALTMAGSNASQFSTDCMAHPNTCWLTTQAQRLKQQAPTPTLPNGLGSIAARGLEAAVQDAQETLRSFPEEVAARNYDTARRQWSSARQQLLERYPDSQPRQPEIRAIWLDRGTIVAAGSPQGLARVFDRLAASGINLVFMETVNAGYPIYPSEVAPEQNPLTQGWDPLAAGVQLAHERGMELHAWVWTFAVGNVAHNRVLGKPLDFVGPVASLHPDWLNYNNHLRLTEASASKFFLDQANPEAREYLLRLFEEIVTRYDVDGLQLDYIRYPFQDIAGGFSFGYGQAARQQFRQQTGVDPLTLTSRSNLWEDWLNFRLEQVNQFVATASRRLHDLRPELTLSVAVFPHPTHERLLKIQQNWELWAKQGDIDLVVLMAYALDTNRFQKLTEPWLTDPELRSTPIIAGIHVPELTDAAVLDQMQLMRDFPSVGYCLFAVDHLRSSLQNRLHPLPTKQDLPLNVLPNRKPFLAAATRFVVLQEEWDFLLKQGKLWVRDSSLKDWEAERANLTQVMVNLAQDPTPAKLRTAREALNQFEEDLPRWFRPLNLEQRYQLQVWQHRLDTLTLLLNYGERAVLEQQRLAFSEVQE